MYFNFSRGVIELMLTNDLFLLLHRFLEQQDLSPKHRNQEV